ncbi:tetratricopeptide repeat protein [Haloferax mediterranei ATCC 33500]|uniref:Tetratricopeptide repeat protein n=1 Tax=Haloferax mediterranei (strain ATCC 33500 / DSM 1411 / JCM 8866 / NBRC 14739 / NCIMB 2177 / R-4) TaxID=523841 RepID=I3R5L3_HALMT|nr:tetratricopeptide repeat protein [Haloferax mediterranei]AFK19523.1 hypothetical protein HFX_1825 [Haloferax mediterranei ATCC 33500]ELZ99843.1 hypothetical protein C439_10928 [Haloferax mediterranei ATCC 33500]MDX5987736.1 tetratricopeptide repeat protein [Haloferax mediterranei ATCC 33500]QCQ74215.1 tetratricopeptide repeat protein [Haloferax mediterranei ATCC 33500]
MLNDDRMTDQLELVSDRFDFLDTLDEGTLDKRELTEALPYSRSTVDRAIRDLITSGLVLDVQNGYTTSLKGRYLVALIRSFYTDAQDVLEFDSFVAEETASYPLPVDVLLGADDSTTATPASHPLDALGNRLSMTNHGTFVFPYLPSQTFIEQFTQWLTDGHSCRLIVPESVITAIWREFPELLETIQAVPDCEPRVGDVPPFAITQTALDGVPHVTIVVYSDAAQIQCVIRNTTKRAVTWTRQYVQSLWEAATPFDLSGRVDGEVNDGRSGESANREPTDKTDQALADKTDQALADKTDQALADKANQTLTGETNTTTVAPEVDTTGTGIRGAKLPTTLQSQGLVRLSPAYFDRVGVSPPLACWRAGFDLGEVRAGYAFDREQQTEDGRKNVTDELFARLRASNDHVVIGPPGAGKSTVCMSVACRWYEREQGPVLYRKSGQREPLTATAHLGSYLAETPGHVLVVVEDATRNEANAVFELVREFADDDQVTFLLDSRENEWRDGTLRGSARLESHRTQSIDVLSVPGVDARERERIVEHFETTVGKRIDIDPDELHPSDQDELTPGEMYLFFHRLARYVEPSTHGDAAPTSLLDDIDEVYESLERIDDELAVDVGVLVNLLNASGVGVDLPLAYTLSSSRQEESVVEDALDALERSVLYSAFGDDEAERVRAVHETWSTRFLQRLLDLESERRARRRFERCLSALFSLVDDERARENVQSVFGGTADIIRTIESDPTTWGNRLVRNVFELGVNTPTLSELYAETDYSDVAVPRACDPELQLDARRWRARMFVNSGELGRAKREFESLIELDDSVFDEEMLIQAHADGFAGISEVSRYRGEFECARESTYKALERFEQIDDAVGRSDVLNALGSIEAQTDNPESAKTQYEQALALRRTVGDDARVASTLANLGQVEVTLGRYDKAREHAQTSLQLRREAQYLWGEAISLDLLSRIELEDGTLDEAERYLKQATAIRRKIGDSMGTALASNNLGRIELERGTLDDARARYEELVETLDDKQLEWVRGCAHHGLAEVLLDMGEADASLKHVDIASDILEQNESKLIEVEAIRARAHLQRGERERAQALAEEVLDRAEHSAQEPEARANAALGLVLVATGETTNGLSHLRKAVEVAPTKVLEGRCLRQLADALCTVGQPSDALDTLERAAECFSAVKARVRERKTALKALELAHELDDHNSKTDFEARLLQ